MARRGWREGTICRKTVSRGDRSYTYWRVAIPMGTDPSGRRLRKEFQCRSEREARARLKDALGRGRQPSGLSVTVGAYAVGWLRDTANTVKPSTAAFYAAQLNHAEAFRNLPLTALTPQHVRDLIAAKTAEGLASRSVRGIVQTLRLVLAQALSDGLVERNVAALVRLPKLEQAAPRHFTAAQARRFLEVAQDDELGSLYAVALATGLRRGELLALTWRDVGTGCDSVVVRRGKTSAASRTIPVAPFAAVALGRMGRHPGPIWPVRPEAVSRRFRELCVKAGVPVLTMHSTRHTAASLMLDAGVDPLTIQAILGHTSVSMTGHYARGGDELRRAAVEALGGTLAGHATGTEGR